MTRPQDMGPADLAPNTVPPETLTPEQARKVERNAFYNSLPLGAQEAFLAALESAARRGLDEESAWMEATRAVEMEGDAAADRDADRDALRRDLRDENL